MRLQDNSPLTEEPLWLDSSHSYTPGSTCTPSLCCSCWRPSLLGPSPPTISFLWAQLTWVSPAFSWHLAAAAPSLGGVEGLGDRALPVVKASEAEALASICRRTGKCTEHCSHPTVMLFSSPHYSPFSIRKGLLQDADVLDGSAGRQCCPPTPEFWLRDTKLSCSKPGYLNIQPHSYRS